MECRDRDGRANGLEGEVMEGRLSEEWRQTGKERVSVLSPCSLRVLPFMGS